MKFLKFEKEGDELFIPINHNKDESRTVYNGSTNIPSGINFYLYNSIIDRISNIAPNTYDNMSLSDNNYMVSSKLNCKNTKDGVFIPVGGKLTYNIKYNFDNSILYINMNGDGISDNANRLQFLLDIDRFLYLHNDSGKYTLRYQPNGDESGYTDIATFTGLAGIMELIIIFVDKKITIFLNGKRICYNSAVNYDYKATNKTYEFCINTRAKEYNYSNNSVYLNSMFVGQYLGTEFENIINLNYDKIDLSLNTGYFHNTDDYINHNIQNEKIFRSEDGSILLNNTWHFNSEVV